MIGNVIQRSSLSDVSIVNWYGTLTSNGRRLRTAREPRVKINVAGSSAGSVGEGPDGMINLGSDVRVYRTPSGTRQGVMHFTVVDLTTDKYPQCSCEGFTFRGKCKHADYAYKVWQKEIEDAQEYSSVGVAEDQDPESAFKDLPTE